MKINKGGSTPIKVNVKGMIKYLIENCGLLSFDVEVGLVSQFEMRGSRLFGIFIGTLYELKKVEDDKKKEGKPFNTPFREACKLLMNSLSGKLVEDPSRYFRLEFDKDGAVMLNGVGVTKVKTKETLSRLQKLVNLIKH